MSFAMVSRVVIRTPSTRRSIRRARDVRRILRLHDPVEGLEGRLFSIAMRNMCKCWQPYH